MVTFNINKVYNFNTLAPVILGDRYENMTVLGILTAEEAMKYRDIYTLHNNLIPVITGLPVNAGDCSFLLLENTSKETTVLAIEYIDPVSVQLVTSVNIRADIMNASTNDLVIITSLLKGAGYYNINLSTFQ